MEGMLSAAASGLLQPPLPLAAWLVSVREAQAPPVGGSSPRPRERLAARRSLPPGCPAAAQDLAGAPPLRAAAQRPGQAAAGPPADLPRVGPARSVPGLQFAAGTIHSFAKPLYYRERAQS